MANLLAPSIENFQKDPGFFIEWALSVVPMSGGKAVPFKLNPGQILCTETLKSELAKGSFVRLIVLKSRRQGISTWSEAVMYWLASCFENHTTLVLAHDKDTSEELFRIAQGFHDTDRRHAIDLMPKLQESSKQAIRFGNPDKKKRHTDPGLNSSMLVETAEGRGVGRGLTLMGYHWAEVAYTMKQGVSAGLNIACSKVPGSVGIWESTANGVGDAFERNWQEAVRGNNDFKPIFLPWNIDPNCRRPLSRHEYDHWKFRPGEEQIAKDYNLDFEQLKFRRITIASPECLQAGIPPEDVFRQEYPLSPEEAFLKRGKNFFLISSLMELEKSEKGAQEPKYNAIITSPLDPSELMARADAHAILPKIEEKGYGPLTVWEEPVPMEDYVIGADPATGTNNDPSVAVILKRSSLEQVAKFVTRQMDPDEFGVACALLGWWYNEALVAIERQGPGTAANKSLRKLHYLRCWYDRDVININIPVKNYMGWNTNSSTRRPMLDRLEEAIRTKEVAIRSQRFYEEARTFIMMEPSVKTQTTLTAKPMAAPGFNDDEIMSMAIALQVHLHGGALRGKKVQPKKPAVDIYDAKVPKDKQRVIPASYYEWWAN